MHHVLRILVRWNLIHLARFIGRGLATLLGIVIVIAAISALGWVGQVILVFIGHPLIAQTVVHFANGLAIISAIALIPQVRRFLRRLVQRR